MNNDKIIFRNHPLMIITQVGKTFYLVLFILLSKINTWKEFYQSIKESGLEGFLKTAKEDALILFIVLCALIICTVVVNFLRWKKTSFTLTSTILEVHQNRLNKKTLTLKKEDISNISESQNILEKLFHISVLSINTNTKNTANETDLKIFLKTPEAKKIKEALKDVPSNKKNTETVENQEMEKQLTKKSIVYSKKEIIRHSLCHISWDGLIIPFFLLCFGGLFLLVNYFFVQDSSLISEIKKEKNILIPLFLSFSLIIAPFISALKTFFKMANFKISRFPNSIEISKGFWVKKSYHIPIDKISSLIIQEQFIARLFQYISIDAINIGFDDEKEETPTLFLIEPLENIQEKLDLILPEFSLYRCDEHQPIKSIGIVIITELFYLSLLTILILYLFAPYWILMTLPLWLYLIPRTYFAWKTPTLKLTTHHLIITEGLFDKKTHLVPLKKLEQLKIESSWKSRIFSLSRIVCSILGKNAAERKVMCSAYFPKEYYQPLVEYMTEKKRSSI